MSSDLISCLRLEEEYNQGRVIVTKEINGGDSSFITSCVIAHCVKSRYPLLIVSTHNSLLHYQNVGIKMNYNLQRHISDGLVQVYNLGEHYVNCLFQEENISLDQIFEKVKEKVVLLQNKSDRVNIIVDGLTHLFNLQYSLKEVNDFTQSLIKMVRNSNSFLIIHCNVACDDDVTYVMANLLSHKAYIVVHVENLTSGLSLDVSGQMVISYPGLKFEEEHMFTLDLKTSQYLFKLFEKGVKLFAPGTV